MSFVPCLLQAIVKVDGEAFVMHAGDKPYVVSPSGLIEFASSGLTLHALNDIVGQLLPAEIQHSLDEVGAVQYTLPPMDEFPTEHFIVVAARGGDDVWVEIRRRRVTHNHPVAEELGAFGSAQPASSPIGVDALPPPAEPFGLSSVTVTQRPLPLVPSAAVSPLPAVTRIDDAISAIDEPLDEVLSAAAPLEVTLPAPIDIHDHDSLSDVTPLPSTQLSHADVSEQDTEVVAMMAEPFEPLPVAVATTPQSILTSAVLLLHAAPRCDDATRAIDEAPDDAPTGAAPLEVAPWGATDIDIDIDDDDTLYDITLLESAQPSHGAVTAPDWSEASATAESVAALSVADAGASASVGRTPALLLLQAAAAFDDASSAIEESLDEAPVAVALLEDAPVTVAPLEDEPWPIDIDNDDTLRAIMSVELAPASHVAVSEQEGSEGSAIVPEPPATVAPMLAAKEARGDEPAPTADSALPAPHPPVAAAIDGERLPVQATAGDPLTATFEASAPVVMPSSRTVRERIAPVAATCAAPHEEAAQPRQPAVVLPISRSAIRVEAPPPPISDHARSGLERLLRVSSARGASTLYLTSGSRPSVRVDSEVHILDGEPLHTSRDVESLLLTLMPERTHEALRTGALTEWSCDIEGVGRVRCMSFRDHRGPGGVFRLLPTHSVSVEQLGLSKPVQALATEPEGLVLVAGPRSSGKRMLMAALVDLMNRTRRGHVITIEREITIVHERSKSLISQREVRGDDDEMVAAVRSALREDPDVLLIEDLRTRALMDVALEAAASGHLVVGGFSAHTATGAIDRIIDLYAPENRRQVQSALADSLRGVVVQVLLRTAGDGRVPVREVLLNTSAVSSVIAEGKTSQLPMAIEAGRRHGMLPMNDALVGLVQSGTVEARDAYRHSTDPAGFVEALSRQCIDTSFVGASRELRLTAERGLRS